MAAVGRTAKGSRVDQCSSDRLRLLGVLIVGSYLELGVATIWIVLSCELTIRGLLIFACFARGKWKKVEV